MLIFLYGDDALKNKERLADMRIKFTEKFDAAGMNVDVLSVQTEDDALTMVTRFVELATSAPFLSEKRMVVVFGVLRAAKKAQAKDWINAIAHVPESTIAIFADVLDGAKAEKHDILVAAKALPHTHVYALASPTGAAFASWATTRAEEIGLTIGASFLRQLILRIGEDVFAVDRELRKLAAYANGAPVTEEMLTLLVRESPDADIFALLDAIAAGNSADTLRKLARERQSGAEEFPLFGMLLRHVRILVATRRCLDEKPGASKDDVAKMLAVHPFVAQKSIAEARHRSSPELVRLHNLAFDLDHTMKNGRSAALVVDRLVAALLVDKS